MSRVWLVAAAVALIGAGAAIAGEPEIAAKKAFADGVKSLDKANVYAAQAEQAVNADKRAKALSKASDAYYKALDQFTEALANDGAMAEAWSRVGYVHLRLGAYAEAVDDYDHAFKLRPGTMDEIEYRAEALLQLNRLEEVKSAYMDVLNHAQDKAERLMRAMQRWIDERRSDPHGAGSAELAAFAEWVKERAAAAP